MVSKKQLFEICRKKRISRYLDGSISGRYRMEPSIQRPWGNGTGIVRGLPVTEELSGRLLRLLVYAGMRDEDLQFTVAKIWESIENIVRYSNLSFEMRPKIVVNSHDRP